MLTPAQKADLRNALRMVEEAVLESIRDKMQANHDSSVPRRAQAGEPFTPLTLEEITYNAGVADGMSGLWLDLQGMTE